MYLRYVEKPPAIGAFGEEESKLQSFSTNWFAGILLHFTKNAISRATDLRLRRFKLDSKLDFRGYVLGFGITSKAFRMTPESSVQGDELNLEKFRISIDELCLLSTYQSSPLFS